MVVDTTDYTVWRDHPGAADESLTNDSGDGLNGVGLLDDDVWKANFGAIMPGSGSGANTTVSEPSSDLLLVIAAAAFHRIVRQRCWA